ncbi:MAG TPA: YbhB/YbcL family Raf kinase inhibitor-like protein [Candidatus Kapabacteria bacterium]|jgi:hypothetical protein
MKTSILIFILVLSGGCSRKVSETAVIDTAHHDTNSTAMKNTLTISTTAFQKDSAIPQKFTCQGEDHSPALAWSGAPENTKSYALVVEDPDAPHGTFYHWVMYDIPPTERGLAENIEKRDRLGNGTRQGTNSFGQMGFNGPCPPPGKPHRYYFKLFALDAMLNIPGEATRDTLMSAMNGHILAEGEIMGTYARK